MNENEVFRKAKRIAEREDLETAETFIENNSDILTFGIETAWFDGEGLPEQYRERVEYINLGGMYNKTVMVDNDGAKVFTLGDWLKVRESEVTESTGLIRCPNCGNWTEQHPDDWWKTECNHCDYLFC